MLLSMKSSHQETFNGETGPYRQARLAPAASAPTAEGRGSEDPQLAAFIWSCERHPLSGQHSSLLGTREPLHQPDLSPGKCPR